MTEAEVVVAGSTSHAYCLRINRPRRAFSRVYRLIIRYDHKLKVEENLPSRCLAAFACALQNGPKMTLDLNDVYETHEKPS